MRIMGEYLRRLRKAGGITQTDLAQAMGIRRNTLHAYETGRRRVTDETHARWVATVRRIARERAEAVDAIMPTGH